MKSIFRFIRKNGFFVVLLCLFTISNPLYAQWVQVLNTGYPGGCVVSCLTYNETKLFAGINDYVNFNNGGMYSSNNDGINWSNASNDLINKNIVAFTACPNGTGGTYLFAGVFSMTGEGGVYRSTDNGTSWTRTISGMDNGSSVYSFAVMPNESSGTYLFAGTNYAQVFRSTNHGSDWTILKSEFKISSFAVSPEGDKLFAGTGDNGVYISTDYGINWNSISSGLTNLNVGTLAISPDGKYLFAGTNGSGVFRSTDNGVSWAPANNGITGLTIHKFACSMNGEIFAAAREGIFISKDNGTSWSDAGSGFTEGAFSIGINNQYIFIGTHDGNIWRRPLSEFNLTTYTLSTSSNPSNGGLTFGGGIFDAGSSVMVQAKPSEGYIFVNWTENGKILSTNSDYTFSIDSNRTLVANFALISPSSIKVSQWGSTPRGSNWPVLNTAATEIGNGSMGALGPPAGWTSIKGGFPGLTATTSQAFVITGTFEFVGGGATGNQYSWLRFALFNETGTLSGQNTSAAKWSEDSNANGYIFTPVTGTGIIPNTYNSWPSGNQGTNWPLVNSKSWNSTNTNGGGPFCTVMQIPQGQNVPAGLYDWAISVQPLTNGSNQVTWYFIQQHEASSQNYYWWGGTFNDPTPGTTTFNSIGFACNSDVDATCKGVNLNNVTASLGGPITIPDHYINLSSSPSNGGTTNGSGLYNPGSSVTVTATPNSNYIFTSWTENGNIVSLNSIYTFTLTESRTLVANFTTLNCSALFDGVNSRIRVTDGGAVNQSANQNAYKINGSSITVEAWVYPLSNPNPQLGNTIISRVLNAALAEPWQSYRLWISNSNGTPQAAFSISSGTPGSQVTVISPDLLPNWQWTHLAGTYNGNSLKIYVNGVLKATMQTNITINSSSGVGMYIGGYSTDRFQGAIEDVRLWNITRSENDIYSNMKNVLQGNENGLAGYWNLDLQSSLNGQNIVFDKTLNFNDLIVLGNAQIIPFIPYKIYDIPIFNLGPSSINFGTVEEGSASPTSPSIAISNMGTSPLIGIFQLGSANINFSSSTVFFVDGGRGQTIIPAVSVIPKVAGQINELVTVRSNAASLSYFTITGTSVPLGHFDVNNISMWVQRNGIFAYNPMNVSAGLEWPKGSEKTAVYSSGIWIGANVGGNVRTAASFYRTEFAPGPIINDVAANPNDFTYRVYKIQKGDNAGSNPDYANWPATLGAPVNADGSPKIIGDQTLFSVYNDLNQSNHFLGSQALGAEVQQTIFGFNQTGTKSNTVFLRFKIINKSGSTWNNAYISLWSDPDLGNPGDDLIGVDTTRNLGFIYNGSDNDQIYGTPPPAAGYQMLKGAFFTKPIQGFSYFTNGSPVPQNDPSNSTQVYNLMKGFMNDGTPYFDPITHLASRYPLSGDPVNSQGWLDQIPADKRFLFTTGPLNMEPGQSKEIIAAIVLGQGYSNLNSITVLKSASDEIQNLFDTGQIFGGALENVATVTVPEGTTNSLNDISNSGAQITVTSGSGGATVEAASYVAPPPGVQTITTPSIASVGKYLEVDVQGTVTWPIPISIYYTRNDLLQAGIVESDLQGIYYWKGLTNQWNLYSNSGSDDQGRGPSTTWIDTTNVNINGVNYEGFAVADAYHLTQMILAAKKKSITERYNFATQFIQSLPDNTFKKPADTRRKQLVKMLDQSKSKYDSGNLKSAAQYLEQNVLNHLTSNNNSGNDLWVTDATTCKTLIRIINELIDVLLRPQTLGKIVNGDMEVVDHVEIPTEYGLSQNYPNPFNPITRIQFGLPENVHTKLIIYDVLGREVATIVNADLGAGYHEVEFNGSNLPSGIYIYRIQAGEFTSVKKMILMK